MADLFERFVRNFFRREEGQYAVAAERILWQRTHGEPEDLDRLPSMNIISLPSPMPVDFYREVQWWRSLLGKVAADLERLASNETDERRARLLRARAMRVRQQLHEGVPADWRGSMPTGRVPKFAGK